MAADPYDHLQRLLPLQTFDDFEVLVASDPGLLAPEVAAGLRSADALPGMGRIFAAPAQLIEDAQSDRRAAWDTYEEAMTDSRRQGNELAAEVLEIERALAAGRYAEVLEKVEEPMLRADQTGNVEICGLLLRQRGRALWALTEPDRIENQERALVDLTGAAILLSADPVVRALTTLELGAASLERIEWDRTWNLEHGLAMIRLAAETLRGTRFEEALDIQMIEALLLQESGDLAAYMREAEGLARAMLEDGSLGEDPVNRAAKQLLLARTLRRGVEIGERDGAEAESAFEAVLAHPGGLPAALLGKARSELGQLLLRSTDQDPDRAFEELVAWLIPRDDEAEERETLIRAGDLLETAIDQLQATPDFEFAIALASLAEVLQRLGDFKNAIERNREALAMLTPRIHPERARPCAQRLGELLAERGEWEGAAEAYEVAIEVAEILYRRRQGSAGREKEAALAIGLARRAAFTVAKTGDPKRATQLLEHSRNREFRLQLEEAGGGDLIDLETDFERAIEDGAPVVYVNPSPWGAVLLVVSTGEREARFEAIFLDGLTGMAVYRRLFFGDAAVATKPEEVLKARGSYLLGTSLLDEGSPGNARERRRREKQRESQLPDRA